MNAKEKSDCMKELSIGNSVDYFLTEILDHYPSSTQEWANAYDQWTEQKTMYFVAKHKGERVAFSATQSVLYDQSEKVNLTLLDDFEGPNGQALRWDVPVSELDDLCEEIIEDPPEET